MSSTEDSMVDDMTEDSMVDDMTDDSMVDDMTDEEGAPLAPWQTLPITDVDGVTFTLGDLVGTPVLVETFATWCSSCRSQLGETNALAEQAGDGAAVVAVSVETDLSSDDVADYAVDNGFSSVRFAVATPELLAALVEAYGPSVANPPATPKIAIDAMGAAGELTTGSESVESMATKLGLGG
jgi:thiol-disulfide isomerase/thioredoxin